MSQSLCVFFTLFALAQHSTQYVCVCLFQFGDRGFLLLVPRNILLKENLSPSMHFYLTTQEKKFINSSIFIFFIWCERAHFHTDFHIANCNIGVLGYFDRNSIPFAYICLPWWICVCMFVCVLCKRSTNAQRTRESTNKCERMFAKWWLMIFNLIFSFIGYSWHRRK